MLWLLRHGEAADGSPDADRPLTDEGQAQSRAAGAALRALGVNIDACLTSPKLRAADTAKLACAELDGVAPQAEPRLAGGPFDGNALAEGLGDDVMLVGHDPGLLDGDPQPHRSPGADEEGGLAGVDRGELKVLLRPRELAAIAARERQRT